ncbi:MAG: hypothetical protein M3Y50_02025 [Acidobacteriota bacterium]|nr:hypothetical protein [Acidobacteriota bacterium]
MNFPLMAAVTANVLGWPMLQLALARISIMVPERFLLPLRAPTRREAQEADLYRRALRIRRWKHLLPDGAPWVGGAFPKQRLASRQPAYLRRFALEARRGELAHWTMLACIPVFYLWNPAWACALMTFYGLAANVPCILVQRYNRIVILGNLCAPATGRNATH